MVLESVTANVPKTPSRAVKYLTSELEKRDEENASLQATIADLSKALDSIKLVNEQVGKIDDKKKNKDAKAPKPAVTAYKYYCEEVKATPKGESKTGKELQEMWKQCEEEARAKYVELATADKKRFEAEKAEYDALQKIYEKREQDAAMAFYEAHQSAMKAQEASQDASKKKKRSKDADAPKRPKSAYMFFCEHKRPEVAEQNKDKPPTEIIKILAEEWSKCQELKGAKGPKKYNDLAAKDKVRYDNEKAEYDAKKAEEQRLVDEESEMKLENDREEARKMVEEAQEEAAKQQKEIEKATKKAVKEAKKNTTGASSKKQEEKPKGPKKPSSAFIYFSTENREKIKSKMGPDAKFGDVAAEVGRQWKELSDKKKSPYVAKANKDKERYQKELDAMKA